jgi:hypothetical protein
MTDNNSKLRTLNQLIFLVHPLLYHSYQCNITCDTCLIFVIARNNAFLFRYEDSDMQLQDILCSANSFESVNDDKVFPPVGIIQGVSK